MMPSCLFFQKKKMQLGIGLVFMQKTGQGYTVTSECQEIL